MDSPRCWSRAEELSVSRAGEVSPQGLQDSRRRTSARSPSRWLVCGVHPSGFLQGRSNSAEFSNDRTMTSAYYTLSCSLPRHLMDVQRALSVPKLAVLRQRTRTTNATTQTIGMFATAVCTAVPGCVQLYARVHLVWLVKNNSVKNNWTPDRLQSGVRDRKVSSLSTKSLRIIGPHPASLHS